MDNNLLLKFLRRLAEHFKADTVDDLEENLETLQMAQDHLALIYEDYEKEPAPEGAELLRELMMEALQLMFLGVDEFFHYVEDEDEARLDQGIALAEEGNDIMASIKFSVENNQEWSGSATLG